MNAIGSGFVFIISLIGTISAFDICVNDKLQFYLDVLKVHNTYRENHNLLPLVFGLDENLEAKRLLKNFVEKGFVDIFTNYGINTSIIDLSTITTLDYAVAKNLVKYWYEKSNEPLNNNAEVSLQFLRENTTKLGISITKKDNMLYVLVTYFLGGNI